MPKYGRVDSLRCFTPLVLNVKYNFDLGMRRGVSGSCSRALEAVRSLRQRLGTTRSQDISAEQKSNFASYKASGRKIQSWTIKVVCLGNKEATRVPCSVAEREILVQAGLGEKKIIIPDVACSPEEFKNILVKSFPKLENCGGFELLKCRPNSKELDPISVMVTQSPAMLKSIMGSGRLFIRPIQQDLDLESHSALTVEVYIYMPQVFVLSQLRGMLLVYTPEGRLYKPQHPCKL